MSMVLSKLRDDRGSVSAEQVAIAAGLVTLALAVVAALTAVVIAAVSAINFG